MYMTSPIIRPALAKVGEPWTPGNIEGWPGVAGVDGVTNYFKNNEMPNLPDSISTINHYNNYYNGGKRKKHMKGKSKKHMKSKVKKHMKKRNTRKHKKSMKRTKRRGLKGGKHHGSTIMPQPLVNLGREVGFSGENFFNTFVGRQAPVDPNPTIQPIGQ